MKILYIVPYVPNLVRVRPYNLIRTLINRGHQVTVATLWSSESERVDIDALIAGGVHKVIASRLTQTRSLWNSLRAIPTNQPLQANYAWHPELTAAIAKELRWSSYDVVHVEHLRGAIYGWHALAALRASGQRVPVVWDSVDSISHLFSQAARSTSSRKGRIITRLELSRTRRHEAKLAGTFNRVLVTSPADREAFLHVSDSDDLAERIAILPNGVDLDYFTGTRCECSEPTLLVSGKMSYHANITMVLYLVKTIMPLVWTVRPEVRVWIVGKDPPASVRALDDTPGNGHQGSTKSLETGKVPSSRVTVTGTVPDMRPYLQQATMAVAPLRYGAGIQNKVLEAMASRLPVIATPIAVSALNVDNGQGVLVADSARTFAAQILALLDDAPQRTQIGARGRAYVEDHHTWHAIGQLLLDNYKSSLSTNDPLAF